MPFCHLKITLYQYNTIKQSKQDKKKCPANTTIKVKLVIAKEGDYQYGEK
jgi:hypothetical protein